MFSFNSSNDLLGTEDGSICEGHGITEPQNLKLKVLYRLHDPQASFWVRVSVLQPASDPYRWVGWRVASPSSSSLDA